MNLDQLTALPSHSRLSRKKLSMVVPACMKALAKVTDVWKILLRASSESLTLLRTALSVRLFLNKNSRFRSMLLVPRRMSRTDSNALSWSSVSDLGFVLDVTTVFWALLALWLSSVSSWLDSAASSSSFARGVEGATASPFACDSSVFSSSGRSSMTLCRNSCVPFSYRSNDS